MDKYSPKTSFYDDDDVLPEGNGVILIMLRRNAQNDMKYKVYPSHLYIFDQAFNLQNDFPICWKAVHDVDYLTWYGFGLN